MTQVNSETPSDFSTLTSETPTRDFENFSLDENILSLFQPGQKLALVEVLSDIGQMYKTKAGTPEWPDGRLVDGSLKVLTAQTKLIYDADNRSYSLPQA